MADAPEPPDDDRRELRAAERSSRRTRTAPGRPADPPSAQHAPWEFLILALFVALIGIGIILGWTLVGSHSPERLDDASAAARRGGVHDRAGAS